MSDAYQTTSSPRSSDSIDEGFLLDAALKGCKGSPLDGFETHDCTFRRVVVLHPRALLVRNLALSSFGPPANRGRKLIALQAIHLLKNQVQRRNVILALVRCTLF